VQVGSFLGASKQTRKVKEALSADFADQVTCTTARCLKNVTVFVKFFSEKRGSLLFVSASDFISGVMSQRA
jgi:hypothetical protein